MCLRFTPKYIRTSLQIHLRLRFTQRQGDQKIKQNPCIYELLLRKRNKFILILYMNSSLCILVPISFKLSRMLCTKVSALKNLRQKYIGSVFFFATLYIENSHRCINFCTKMPKDVTCLRNFKICLNNVDKQTLKFILYIGNKKFTR